jgi:hypothetical protein
MKRAVAVVVLAGLAALIAVGLTTAPAAAVEGERCHRPGEVARDRLAILMTCVAGDPPRWVVAEGPRR